MDERINVTGLYANILAHSWRSVHQLATAASAEPSRYDVAVGYGDVESLIGPLDLGGRCWYEYLSAERCAVAPSTIFTVAYNV